MQKEFEEVRAELQSELEASKQVNILLLTEIQRVKSQEWMSEQAILQSTTVRKLREEAEDLLKQIDDKNDQIAQFKVIKESFDKLKSDLAAQETLEKERLKTTVDERDRTLSEYKGLVETVDALKAKAEKIVADYEVHL